MKVELLLSKLFFMTDSTWEKHANPWSVYTRFVALPLLTLAIWSRTWIEGYSIILIAVLLIWIYYNPKAFKKPKHTNSWASKAVLGERLMLHKKEKIPEHHLKAITYIKIFASISFITTVYGVIFLHIWLSIFGIILTILTKLWFLDRMVWLYQDLHHSSDIYKSWNY